MLPENEANLFMYNLMKNPFLEDYVLNNRKNLSKEECDFFKKLIPKTWNFFHTQNDDFYSLTLESFTFYSRTRGFSRRVCKILTVHIFEVFCVQMMKMPASGI